MKAIINGKIILKDRVVDNMALLYSNVIEGIVTADQIPAGAEIIDADISAKMFATARLTASAQ